MRVAVESLRTSLPLQVLRHAGRSVLVQVSQVVRSQVLSRVHSRQEKWSRRNLPVRSRIRKAFCSQLRMLVGVRCAHKHRSPVPPLRLPHLQQLSRVVLPGTSTPMCVRACPSAPNNRGGMPSWATWRTYGPCCFCTAQKTCSSSACSRGGRAAEGRMTTPKPRRGVSRRT